MIKKIIVIVLIFQVLNSFSQKAGINFSYIDSSASPQNDFYKFCNGKWEKNFVLPESDARYGSFNEINNNNLKHIKTILDNASKNTSATPNSDAQKLRDFYNTAIDSNKADKLGYTPIKNQLSEIDKIKNVSDIISLKSKFDFDGVTLFFGGYVSVDAKNSKKNVYGISQAGLGLGDRDYYYGPQFENIRKEYINYLSALFKISKNISGITSSLPKVNAEATL